MIYTVNEFGDKFRTIVGDSTLDVSDEFLLNCINWAFNELPVVPKLGKLFSHHYHFNLDAKGHYKWKLNGDFRRLIDIPMMNFYTSNGGDPCKLEVCGKDVEDFYNINGVIELKQPGIPCQYTIEEEDDDIYLVFDRPLDCPVIIDYIAYGFPTPVTSGTDTIQISAIAEPLILSVMKTVFFYESDDFAFAGNILDYVDNKKIPEAIQALNKRWGASGPAILGEN